MISSFERRSMVLCAAGADHHLPLRAAVMGYAVRHASAGAMVRRYAAGKVSANRALQRPDPGRKARKIFLERCVFSM
ncbi:MAG: hypothetical protein DI635_16475 [Pseudoxanthomonas suwonensis]|nr:MAG: hypothetical protein DI635_16475 [Pseudoxanthomonas suwonensis]